MRGKLCQHVDVHYTIDLGESIFNFSEEYVIYKRSETATRFRSLDKQ